MVIFLTTKAILNFLKKNEPLFYPNSENRPVRLHQM